MKLFTVTDRENCRKFFKRIYDFEKPISELFVTNVLSDFGALQINRFSEMMEGSLDFFKITKGDIEISGAINSCSIYMIIPKSDSVLLEQLETELTKFLSVK